MEFRELRIKGLFEVTPRLFKDERGYFFESYSEKAFKENGFDIKFVQDNQSYSTPGVVRGLHFQKEPYGQAKLVRVLKGKILDVVVDLRKDSPTFGQYESIILDDVKCNMLFVPIGFAHGFAALEETLLFYKCSNLYNKASESGVNWNDPSLKIDWHIKDPVVSEKDQELKNVNELDYFF